MTRVSYAQNGEDVRVWRAFRDVHDGFYVEVGASDPWDDSTTAALSALGWSGLLVEADVALAQRLREARPRDVVVQAAAHSRGGLLDFDPGTARGLGAVVDTAGQGTARVAAVRVGDLLADLAPEVVHYLSVDVEGGELEALRGADLERWQPRVLSVESTLPNSRTPSHDAWEPLVLSAGYTLAGTDGLNRWYVAAGHEHLAPLVAEPFNALDENLDGWFRSKEVALREQVQRLVSEHAAALAAQQAALQRDLQAERTALLRAQEELAAVAAVRDAALARERVLLTSKSWALTQPLRSARLAGWLTLQQVRSGRAPVPAVRLPDGPGDVRRRQALVAKVEAARRARP